MDPNDGDVTVSEDGGSGISRRDAIKKGAIVGGAVVWATPVIQAIGINPAGAQTPSPTNPGGACPGCANCTARARGLVVEGLVDLTAGVATGTQCTCTLDVNLDLSNLADAKSQTVCGRANSSLCRASALVEGLDVQVLENVFLRASVLSSCVNCGTGASQVADLRLLVNLSTGLLGGIFGPAVAPINVPLTVNAGCNTGIVLPTTLDTNVLGNILTQLGIGNLLGNLSTSLNNILGSLSPLLAITANEQTCTNGTLTVRALHVVVAGQHVIVAESSAGGPGCACAACSPNPTCTPPAAGTAANFC